MILIGVHGKKHSGKDTIVKLLREKYNDTIQRIAFADPLKEEVAKAFGVTVDYIEKNKEKFRHILQAWGVLKRELCGDDYWIKKLLAKAVTLMDDCICFVPDTRFINEANTIRNCGGYVWSVRRECWETTTDTHVSETQLDNYNFDTTIINNGTLQQLKHAAITELHKLITNRK